MWKYHVLACIVKPSSSADMKYHLAVANWEVVDAMLLGEAVGTEVMPFIYTEVTLIKMDMDDATFQPRLLYDAGLLFSDIADFKHFKNTIWKNDFQKGFVR